jgi:hypothetical protein
MNLEYIIDKFDKLPYREQFFLEIDRKKWYSGYDEMHPTNHIKTWDRIERILQNNIGKSFNLAFSYYCKQVPKYQQHLFLEKFNVNRRYSSYYFVDENSNIQYHKYKWKTKQPIKFNIIPDEVMYEVAHPYWWKTNKKVLVKDKPDSYRNYKKILLKDNAIYFESKNDPKFKRLHAEQQQKNKLDSKRSKKIPKLSNEQFTAILKAKELKDKQKDLVKIISHGFDPLLSFRK